MRVGGDAGPEGLIPTTDRFGVALSDIVRCTDCGHMQLASSPTYTNLAAQYAETASGDYLVEEVGQRLTARNLLDRIEHRVPPGRLLDVGCWVGFLLDEARKRGWEVTGIEPSAFASAYAREQLHLQVHTTDLFSAELGGQTFDAIVMADVIEHLPDPGKALDVARSLTRPGGILLLTLPDAGSRLARALGPRWWSVIPTHVQYFTRKSLGILLAERGWELLDTATAPKAFTVGYYLSRIGGYSRGLADSVVRIAGAMRLAERTWAPDFRDRMCVVARSSAG